MKINRFVFLMLIQIDEASSMPLYVVRLLAFVLILVAILDKTARKRSNFVAILPT